MTFIVSSSWIIFLHDVGAVRPVIEDDVSDDSGNDNREPGAEKTQ